MGKQEIFVTLATIIIFISIFTSISCIGPVFVMTTKANPGDISENWYNTTTLNVTVLYKEPRINWYDFQYNQSGTWVSKLNTQIDVNDSAEYRFVVNISSDQGWADVKYVNITAWYDEGSESTTYNQTSGGNLNLYLQYENTTGTAVWRLLWPDDEVTEGEYTDVLSTDPYGSPGHTECHNLTFSFIPGYQFRHAPGDGSWANNYNTSDDAHSWNFEIYADDGGNSSYVIDEFGVYSYTEIISAGWPTITGNPGENATADSNISIVTRSNGNYSLSVNVSNLTHNAIPLVNISRERVWVRGGDLATSTNFTSVGGVIYFYGSAGTYHLAEANDVSLTTSDIEYKCDIPIGQAAGDYTANIWYHLITTT
jgi:hypothetical protein